MSEIIDRVMVLFLKHKGRDAAAALTAEQACRQALSLFLVMWLFRSCLYELLLCLCHETYECKGGPVSNH